MNKKKTLFSITCVLFLLLLTGCENMFFGVVVSSPVDIPDIPSKDKIGELKNNENNEKAIEELFKEKTLWKTTVEIVKNYPVNIYFEITDAENNIAEFNTSNELKSYKYKVTDNNWILLTNKTESVAFKYSKQYKEYLIVQMPAELFILNSPSIGYDVKMEESTDKVTLEHNSEIYPSEPPVNPEDGGGALGPVVPDVGGGDSGGGEADVGGTGGGSDAGSGGELPPPDPELKP